MFYSSYGSLMHEIIADYFRHKVPKDQMPVKFLIAYREKVGGDRPDAKIVERYVADGLGYLRDFRPFDCEPLEIESRYAFRIKGIPFVGFIDFLGEKDGGKVVIDHKSRALKPRSGKEKLTANDREINEMMKQLYVYAEAVRQRHGDYPGKLCLNCFRTGNLIEEGFDAGRCREAVEEAADTVREIESARDFPPRPDYYMCRYLCGVHNECCYYLEDINRT